MCVKLFFYFQINLFKKMPQDDDGTEGQCQAKFHACLDDHPNDDDAQESVCMEGIEGWCYCIGFTQRCEMPKNLFQSLMSAAVSTLPLPLNAFSPPTHSENDASGPIEAPIEMSNDPSSRFKQTLTYSNSKKLQYASTNAHYMTERLEQALLEISDILFIDSGGTERIYVEHAWEPPGTAGFTVNSLHREGRAATIVSTTGATPVENLASIAIASGKGSWFLHEKNSQGQSVLHISVPQVANGFLWKSLCSITTLCYRLAVAIVDFQYLLALKADRATTIRS